MNGVTRADLEQRAELSVGDNLVCVPLPWVLLKSKLANSIGLEQTDRQDVKHVRLMLVVMREYLKDIAASANSENELHRRFRV